MLIAKIQQDDDEGAWEDIDHEVEIYQHITPAPSPHILKMVAHFSDQQTGAACLVLEGWDYSMDEYLRLKDPRRRQPTDTPVEVSKYTTHIAVCRT